GEWRAARQRDAVDGESDECTRHDDVADDELERHAVEKIQSSACTIDSVHLIAELLEHLRADLGDVRIVLDQERRSAVQPFESSLEVALLRGSLHARQVHRHAGSVSQFAPDCDGAPGLMRKSMHLRQAKSAAFACSLGGEKQVEHPWKNVGSDSGADIRNT